MSILGLDEELFIVTKRNDNLEHIIKMVENIKFSNHFPFSSFAFPKSIKKRTSIK